MIRVFKNQTQTLPLTFLKDEFHKILHPKQIGRNNSYLINARAIIIVIYTVVTGTQTAF